MRALNASSEASASSRTRDQHVHAVIGAAEQLGQLLGQRPLALVLGVVEEVLLELVEDQVRVAPRVGRLLRGAERRDGSPDHDEKTITSASGSSPQPPRDRRRASSELLPTPLAP